MPHDGWPWRAPLPLRVPAAEELHQQGVVARRVSSASSSPCSPAATAAATAWLISGQQPHHELVVGGPDDGGVKFPVRLRPVLSRPNAVRSTAAPWRGCLPAPLPWPGRRPARAALGLKNAPQLEQVPQAGPRTCSSPEKPKSFDLLHPLRRRRCPCPAGPPAPPGSPGS